MTELCKVVPSPRAWASHVILRESAYVKRQAESCCYLKGAYAALVRAAPRGLKAGVSEAAERLLAVHRRQYEDLVAHVGEADTVRDSYYFSTLYGWFGFDLTDLGEPTPEQFLTILMLHVAAYQRGEDRYEALLQQGPEFEAVWESFRADARSNARVLSELIQAHYTFQDVDPVEAAVRHAEAEVIRRIWDYNGIYVCY